jgi:hypothetical protein
MKIISAALVAAAFLIPASAQATVTFNVNATDSGGGTLTGTFSTNDALNEITGLNLVASSFGGVTFNNLAFVTAESLPTSFTLQVLSPERNLNLVFSPALSALGASIGAGSFINNGGARGALTLSGTVTAAGVAAPTAAVPEPSTWATMLVGFGALGFTMRRRRQQAQVRYGFA